MILTTPNMGFCKADGRQTDHLFFVVVKITNLFLIQNKSLHMTLLFVITFHTQDMYTNFINAVPT